MCGICGVIASDPVSIEVGARAMMRAMHHRGPDDEGYELLPMGDGERGPFAGLGFRRLSILDLTAAGHQPMFNPNTGDCLVYNGELYNFRRLRAELQTNGVIFSSTGDTEVVLKALSTWGEAALERFNGMFSLAFYHAASRRILLARDPIGIKPLYVAALPDRFAFASEIRALLASGLVPSDPDLAGITGMLAYGALQAPRTAFAAIRSFPAGSSQWIDAGSVSGRRPAPPRRFWQFPTRPLQNIQPEAAQEEVRQRLHDAVLRHLVADVPVGVFLSAGIDSTIVMAFAREYTPRVKAFTVGFGAIHGQDEVPIAAATAKALGVEHVAVELDATNLPDKWHDWLSVMDSPSVDGFNTYVVSRRLAQEGVTVGLSGLGADELFGGYPQFSRAPRLARLLRALTFAPRGLRAGVIRTLGALNGNRAATDKLADAVMGDPSVAGIAKSARRLLSDTRLATLGLGARLAGLAADYLEVGPDREDPALDGDAFNTVSRMEMAHYMRDMLLRDTDANSMRHSLEVRVPFLDLPLVEYVSSLPGSTKHRGRGHGKHLLRSACRTVLSDAVAHRSKTGFTLPIGDWMRNEMRDSCESAIDRLAAMPFFDGTAVRQLWDGFVANPASTYWSRPLALVVLGSQPW